MIVYEKVLFWLHIKWDNLKHRYAVMVLDESFCWNRRSFLCASLFGSRCFWLHNEERPAREDSTQGRSISGYKGDTCRVLVHVVSKFPDNLHLDNRYIYNLHLLISISCWGLSQPQALVRRTWLLDLFGATGMCCRWCASLSLTHKHIYFDTLWVVCWIIQLSFYAHH